MKKEGTYIKIDEGSKMEGTSMTVVLGQAEKDWQERFGYKPVLVETFVVYLDADNNLEDFGIEDFLEMAEVGSNKEVNIIVQFDRINGYDYRYDGWATCKRFCVIQGMTPTCEEAIEDLGEINMRSSDTLTNFMN